MEQRTYPTACPSWVKRAADRAKAVVGAMLPASDDGPLAGRCLVWAMVGAACLEREGARAVIQGGTAFFRRVPFDAPGGETDRDMFGFKYDPGDVASQYGMAMGGMPEFHAWVGVKAAPLGYEPVPDGGLMVDFSAASVPAMVDPSWGWHFDPPPFPLVMSGEMDGRVVYYAADEEACLMTMLMGRRRARKSAAVLGDLYGHAMAACGGRALKPVTVGGRTYEDFSDVVHSGEAAVTAARLMMRARETVAAGGVA